jgi:putative MATE family efflux protein
MALTNGTSSISKDATKNSTQDLTEGKPLKLLFFFSIPLILGNLFQQFYNMCDTIIVGRLLGTEALAAVGNTGPMNFLVLGFVYGLTSGFAVITAQKFGAKDEINLRRSVAMNIILNLLSTIIFTALALITTRPLLKLINTPSSIMEGSVTYISIIYWGIGATVLYNCAACILRAVGDSKTPLYFLILSSILNIFLDIFFILYFKMGVAGAAWATVISQAIAGILSVIYIIVKFPILQLKPSDFVWENWFASCHLKIGCPMAFQFSVTAIGVIILQGALNLFGAEKIAAYTAAQKVEQILAVAAGSIGVAMANYGGQNIGARKINRIKAGTNSGVFLTICFALFAAAIALVFPEQLSSLFIDKASPGAAEVIAASKNYIIITSIFYPVLFIIFIYRNILQSIGKTFMPLMAGFFELIARTIAAYTLPGIIGYTGIIIAGPIAWFSAAIPLWIAYMVIIKKLEKEYL